jgi:S-adenosylmethionine-diacylglycerol 3-amino-3-carboxypropyl transferase
MPEVSIEERTSFDFIRYANVWEDVDLLCAGLKPAEGKRILSIASGGDNAFALAGEGAEVVAADLNPSQLACLELKRAAFRNLDYEAVLAFFGIHESGERADTYQGLRSALSEAARAFWDSQPEAIATGFIHAGKFERYFTTFRKKVLPWIHSRKHIDRLMEEKSQAEREDYYANTWNTWRWRKLFQVFFSRFVMGRMGRDPEFFKYVEGSVAERILTRAEYALTVLPTHQNPFLDYILTGNYRHALPRYLRPEMFEKVRAGMDRITTFLGPIQEAAAQHGEGGFDGYNLSDLFEYLDEPLCETIYGTLLDHANPGARLAYWNMLVPRSCPEAFADRVTFQEAESAELFAKDLAFFYSAFKIDEVKR